MGNIFYLIGTFIAILNINCIIKHKQIFDVTEWLSKFKQVTGKSPTIKDFRDDNSPRALLEWSITVILTSLWMIIGLLSSNWILFLIMMIINILINRLSRFIKYNSIKRNLLLVKSFMVTGFIILLIVNHFHLKLNLVRYIFHLLC